MWRSKAERKAWWKALTPAQQKDYVAQKMAEQHARQLIQALDEEFRRIVA